MGKIGSPNPHYPKSRPPTDSSALQVSPPHQPVTTTPPNPGTSRADLSGKATNNTRTASILTREREESRRLREERELEVRRRWTRHHAPEKQEKEVCLHGRIG
ncbi:unnamed protein product, partial [Brassica rapa subsp. narinosa]